MNIHKVIRGKTLGRWKLSAEDDYNKTPISVLKYITVLEDELASKTDIIDHVSGIFMVEDRGKPLSFHQTKEGAEKAVKDWEESTISGEWNIVPIKTLP